MKIIERKLNLNTTKLEILETISRNGERRKIGKVKQTKNQLVCIPSTPLGYHTTVHDANENYSTGIVQVSTEKGIFKISPPEQTIGSKIRLTEIPPFGTIKGILHLPPEPPGVRFGILFIPADALWQQSQRLADASTNSNKMEIIDSDITSFDDIGTDYFLVEPMAVTLLADQLTEWSKLRTNSYDQIDLVAYVFEGLEPWLAIVIAKRAVNNQGRTESDHTP